MTASQSTDGLRIREAVRAVVLDPVDRVLLVRFEFPDAGTRWALPGGGLEPGESHHDALRRELAEEAGLDDIVIGPHIWTRLHIIPFINGRYDGQREQVYLARCAAFEPRPQLTWEQLHSEYVFEVSWHRIDELAAIGHLAPASLPHRLAELLRDGPPIEPVDVGV